MTDPPDPLDVELSALRPRAVSPGLRCRVADRMAAPPPRRWWIRGLALALAVVAAAGGLLLVAPWRPGPPPPEPSAVVPVPPATLEPEDATPTLAACRRALGRSPEDLDALLDRAVASKPNDESAPMRVGTFPRSAATLDALSGDY